MRHVILSCNRFRREAHAHIDPYKCFGCGLCRRACDAGAISLVTR